MIKRGKDVGCSILIIQVSWKRKKGLKSWFMLCLTSNKGNDNCIITSLHKLAWWENVEGGPSLSTWPQFRAHNESCKRYHGSVKSKSDTFYYRIEAIFLPIYSSPIQNRKWFFFFFLFLMQHKFSYQNCHTADSILMLLIYELVGFGFGFCSYNYLKMRGEFCFIGSGSQFFQRRQ